MDKLHALALTSLLLASPAAAQHIVAWPIGMPNPIRILPIVPRPPQPTPRPPIARPPAQPILRPMPAPVPLELTGYSVDGGVEGSVANLTYHVTFHNPTSQRLEGELVMPIPADTTLSGFQMTMGGKLVKGELLEADQARRVYENIVRSMRDPGLLELMGERMIRARVFPIEPNGSIAIRMEVTQVLRKSGELVALRVPRARKEKTTYSISLDAQQPLRALYSPSSAVRISRLGDKRARITCKSCDEDLNLFWSTQQDPLAAGLLAFREKDADGFFLLSLNPKAQAEAEPTPKDLVFVVDRSGSMEEGGKMEQARQALTYVISKLDAGDRFGIVDFATGVESFETALVAATPENKKRALAYIKALEAAGGTNIEGGLKQGLELLKAERGRLPMLFFMTDGLPTVGSTDVEAILRAAAERNEALRARLFTFGVGADVNTLLLDKLAASNRGAGDYVTPEESIETKVSALYQKVAKPAITDVKLTWEGLEATQVYPKPVEDLFHGSELIVMGRYKGAGKGTLKVTGLAGGKPVSFSFPVELPAEATRHSFVPRLWAGKRVAHELDLIRLSGKPADPEVVRDIVKLAKRYGIVTPFTSFLVLEEGANLAAAASDSFEQMRAEARVPGFRAQKQSLALSALRGATSGGPSGGRLREAAGKTFYLRGDVWVDGELELSRGHAEVRVAALSEEYFELLRRKPSLARWLSVGGKVKVLDGGTAYIIE